MYLLLVLSIWLDSRPARNVLDVARLARSMVIAVLAL
jgi:hypothetical protein